MHAGEDAKGALPFRKERTTLGMMQTHTEAVLRTITVGMTGASGSMFTRELLLALERDERVGTVNFVASDNALRVVAEELGLTGRNNLVAQLVGAVSKKIQLQNNDDIGANVASGSYPTDAMIVIPCSM